jgi:ketosteroid isomerase-like protein
MPAHRDLFDSLDRMDADAWIAHLAPDVVMQFANEDPVYGHASCRERAHSLFDSVRSISHEQLARWEHGDATIAETRVTVGLPDDSSVTIPMVTIYRTDTHDLIADYRIYLDPSPLWP